MGNKTHLLGDLLLVTAYPTINKNASLVINKGYGLLVLYSSSVGDSAIFCLNAGSATLIAGQGNFVTITKVTEFQITVTANDNINKLVLIGS